MPGWPGPAIAHAIGRLPAVVQILYRVTGRRSRGDVCYAIAERSCFALEVVFFVVIVELCKPG